MTTETIKSMLQIQPFKACRYNPENVKFEEVLAPPYDVISSEKQDALYALSPHNSIRLILNKKEESDNEENNIYLRAKNFFDAWMNEKVLIQEDKPCFYIYKQTFKHPFDGSDKERYALLTRVKTEPFENGIIIPHEKTLKGPKADRMNLIKTTETNFSPVFGLFEDSDASIFDAMKTSVSGTPVFEVVDDAGISHALWILDDEATISKIQNGMTTKKVYIADGHHRYETSLEYTKWKREQEGNPEGLQPYDFTLMALVSFSDPGFLLLETHRLLKTLPFSKEECLEKLKDSFEIKEVDSSEIGAVLEAQPENPISFGLAFKGQSYLLTLKDKDKAKEIIGREQSEAWYDLNVNILGHLIFVKLLGIAEDQWEGILKFEHEAAPSIDLVEKGEVEAAFLLKAPAVEMLEKLGEHGERMPQKSTYFYPKLASGIVFNHHS